MRELCVDLFSTLDGFGGGGTRPVAYFGYGGPGLDAWVAEQLAVGHVTLMGATTYRMLAAVAADGEHPTGMDELEKVVFSSTLRAPLTWANTTVVAEPVDSAVPTLKATDDDRPMRTVGSFSLVRSLLGLGLVDRIRLLVFPTLRGESADEPVLARMPDVDLDLRSSTVLDDRLVLVEYRVLPVSAEQRQHPVPRPGT